MTNNPPHKFSVTESLFGFGGVLLAWTGVVLLLRDFRWLAIALLVPAIILFFALGFRRLKNNPITKK